MKPETQNVERCDVCGSDIMEEELNLNCNACGFDLFEWALTPDIDDVEDMEDI
jgi:hypothetical protein